MMAVRPANNDAVARSILLPPRHDNNVTPTSLSAAATATTTTKAANKWNSDKAPLVGLLLLAIFSICVSNDFLHVVFPTNMANKNALSNSTATTTITSFTSTSKHDSKRISTNGTIIDIVSIGSNTRFDYLQAQMDTFGSSSLNHATVRHFVSVTEDDDPDQTCHANLTNEDSYNISNWCHEHNDKPKRPNLNQQPLTWQQRYSKYFISRKALQQKSNPMGWLCAQRRVLTGLTKVYKLHYQSNNDTIEDEWEKLTATFVSGFVDVHYLVASN